MRPSRRHDLPSSTGRLQGGPSANRGSPDARCRRVALRAWNGRLHGFEIEYTRRQNDAVPIMLSRVDHVYVGVPPSDLCDMSVIARIIGAICGVRNPSDHIPVSVRVFPRRRRHAALQVPLPSDGLPFGGSPARRGWLLAECAPGRAHLRPARWCQVGLPLRSAPARWPGASWPSPRSSVAEPRSGRLASEVCGGSVGLYSVCVCVLHSEPRYSKSVRFPGARSAEGRGRSV